MQFELKEAQRAQEHLYACAQPPPLPRPAARSLALRLPERQQARPSRWRAPPHLSSARATLRPCAHPHAAAMSQELQAPLQSLVCQVEAAIAAAPDIGTQVLGPAGLFARGLIARRRLQTVVLASPSSRSLSRNSFRSDELDAVSLNRTPPKRPRVLTCLQSDDGCVAVRGGGPRQISASLRAVQDGARRLGATLSSILSAVSPRSARIVL